MLRFAFVTLLLIAVVVSAAAQSQQANKHALHLQLQQASNDSNRIQLLIKLSHFSYPFSTTQIDSSLVFLQQALKLSTDIQSKSLMYQVLSEMGNYYMGEGNITKAKESFSNIIDSIEKEANANNKLSWLQFVVNEVSPYDSLVTLRIVCLREEVQLYDQLRNADKAITTTIDIADAYLYENKLTTAENELLQLIETRKPTGHYLNQAYFFLSLINRYSGDFNKALGYSLKCIQGVEQTKDTVYLDFFYGEIALVYQELGATEKSIEWYQKSLDIRKKTCLYPFIIYRTAGFLAGQFVKQKKYKQASQVINSLLIDNPPKNSSDKAILLQVKAKYYNSINEYNLAEKYYLQMMNSDGFKSFSEPFTCVAYQDLGEFYLQIHQYNNAEKYFRKALQTSLGEITMSQVRDIHLRLFAADSAMGNYAAAIMEMQKYNSLNDSLFNEAKSRQIEELQISYETKKKDQEIKIKEQSIQLLTKQGELEVSRANLLKNVSIVSGTLMLIILGLLYSRYIIKHRANNKLLAQQKEINKNNNSLRILVDEKEWLLKEIHHRVKNNLQIIMGLLNSQAVYLQNSEALVAIKDSQHRVNSISLIHQKLYQTEALSIVNMNTYIFELISYLKDSFNTQNRIHFSLEIEHIELDVAQAVPLGLILNEAITNSIKYAFPDDGDGQITVSFQRTFNGRIELVIADNGIGLPINFDKKGTSSLGMSLIRGLSEDIDGEFTIESNMGTLLAVIFTKEKPLQKIALFTTKQETKTQ